MTNILNIESLKEASTHYEPFPYFVVEQSISTDHINTVLDEFPDIKHGGSFTLDKLESGPTFNSLIEEINGQAFREQISSKLGLDLQTLPMVVTLRGISRAKDGRVHTDSKSKIATILIYFNEDWTSDSGKLRILHSNNMDDMAAEVAPNAGTLLAFKVTDNCWHGYPSFEGQRRSIQINFVADDKAIKKHHNRHAWTAKLKSLKNLFS